MQQLSTGTTLQDGKYIIERILGQGGFCITYLAIHSFLEKHVAIKEFFPKDFLSEHHLPTTKQFEELIERCSWTTFSENGMHGYKIIGSNGNILMMPLGILNWYISAECLKPNSLYYYFLYLGEYTHTLAKGVPTEANIWIVKQ